MNPLHPAIFAALHAQAFPAEPWDEATFTTLLPQPGMRPFLHERGGFLLLRIVLDEAEIITIGSVVRRQGIASALLAQSIAAARAGGATKLHLEVAEDNTAARALYTKFGFTLAGRRRAYYPNGANALILTLDLA